MTTQIEIAKEVTMQMLAERQAYWTECSQRGRQEGISWAQNSGYAELSAVYRGFNEKYQKDGIDESYYVSAIIADEEIGDYWKELLDDNPDIKAASCWSIPGVVASEEANRFVCGWIEGVEEYFDALQDEFIKIDEDAQRQALTSVRPKSDYDKVMEAMAEAHRKQFPR